MHELSQVLGAEDSEVNLKKRGQIRHPTYNFEKLKTVDVMDI